MVDNVYVLSWCADAGPADYDEALSNSMVFRTLEAVQEFVKDDIQELKEELGYEEEISWSYCDRDEYWYTEYMSVQYRIRKQELEPAAA